MNLWFIHHDFIFFIHYFDTFNAVMFITVLAFQQVIVLGFIVVRSFEIFLHPVHIQLYIRHRHPYRVIFLFVLGFI